MFKTHRKKIFLLFAIIVFIGVLTVGYFSAQKKSEPIYQSKIDQIMFDNKNKSPKYVINLPDRDKTVLAQKAAAQTTPQAVEEEVPFSLQKVLENVPSLSKITPVEGSTPLKHINNNPDITETLGKLKLPKISSNSQKPWIEYSNTVYVQPGFHRVAIIINDLGVNSQITDVATKGMPKDTSFAFSPYAKNTDDIIKAARRLGHETYVDLLLPSQDFSAKDSGPLSIDFARGKEATLDRIRKILSTKAPIGGVVLNKGDLGNAGIEQIKAILEEIKSRGLLLIDATGNEDIKNLKIAGLPRQKADIVISKDFNAE